MFTFHVGETCVHCLNSSQLLVFVLFDEYITLHYILGLNCKI